MMLQQQGLSNENTSKHVIVKGNNLTALTKKQRTETVAINLPNGVVSTNSDLSCCFITVIVLTDSRKASTVPD